MHSFCFDNNPEAKMSVRYVQRISSFSPELLSILRIISAASFFSHGTIKLFAWPAPFEYPLNPMLYTAGILEVVGGLMLALGLFTRPVAFLLSGLMAFAYFMVHSPNGFFPVLKQRCSTASFSCTSSPAARDPGVSMLF
jgi:putative oxidoreductase